MLIQAEVESEIMRLSALLEQRTEEYAEACIAEAEAEVAHKHKAGRTMIGASNQAVAAKTHVVAMRCEEEFTTYRLAKALTESTKQSLLSIRAQLSALQTLARIIGDQV